ncbi:hypothetical protein QQ045_024032 [Rhodiola kirilowii]
MDKSWMNLADKCDPRFAQGIVAFINFVKQNKPRSTTHKCPCKRCRLHHERQLGEYKRYVRNARYPEECIAEQYITHECVTYCKLYMDDQVDVESPNVAQLYDLNVYSPLIKVSGHCPRIKLSAKQLDMAHWSVLEHCEQAKEYIVKHAEKFAFECPNLGKKQRVKHFIKYFRGWRGVYSDSSLAQEDEIEIANAKENDPYQERMPIYVTARR